MEFPSELRVDPGVAIAAPDYRAAGPSRVSLQQGELASPHGCTLQFTRYLPAHVEASSVVLAHGFLRSRRNMIGVARHLASWGVPVVSIELCNSSLFDGAHQRNADDLRALTRHLSLSGVVYAGFSAGALSAVLAAAEDRSAVSVLALDLVDDSELAARAALELPIPVRALTAEPSRCNADGNGADALLASSNARVLRVHGASHCHFEVPLDAACLSLCGGERGASTAAAVQGVILAMSVAAVRGEAPSKRWWSREGAAYERLEIAGYLSAP